MEVSVKSEEDRGGVGWGGRRGVWCLARQGRISVGVRQGLEI